MNETYPLALSSNKKGFSATLEPIKFEPFEKTQEKFHCKATCTPKRSDTFLSGTVFVHERTSSSSGFEPYPVRPSLPRSTEAQHFRKMPRDEAEEQDQKRPVSVSRTRNESKMLPSTSQKSDEHSKSRLFKKPDQSVQEVSLSSSENTRRCLEISLRNVQFPLSEDLTSLENETVGAMLTAHELEAESEWSETQVNIEPQLENAVKNLNLTTIKCGESCTRVQKSADETWRPEKFCQSQSVETAFVTLGASLSWKSQLSKPKPCSGRETVLPLKPKLTAEPGRLQPAHQADVDYGGEKIEETREE